MSRKNRICSWLLAGVLLPAISGCGAQKHANVEKDQDGSDPVTEEPGGKKNDSGTVTAPEQDGNRGWEPVRVMYGVPPASYKY